MANQNSKGPVFEAEAGWGGKIGDWLNANKIWVFPALIVIILILALTRGSGSDSSDVLVSASPTESSAPAPATSSKIVITGDSYTTVARRAVAVSVSENIGKGARLYAETKLAQSLKTQPLIVGSTITFSESMILGYITEYDTLYPSQKAKWEAMAKNIKF